MTTPAGAESIVLCEGYYDRSFWQGWLRYMGCADLAEAARNSGVPISVTDVFGEKVGGGQFYYANRSGGRVRVVPCGGVDRLRPAARRRLAERSGKPKTRIVLALDVDLPVGAYLRSLADADAASLLQLATEFDEAAHVNDDGDVAIDGGTCILSQIGWVAGDDPADGLPAMECLERLVCAAIVAAYPDRAPCVQNWLDRRPAPAASKPKHFAWSYMAGWHAEQGCAEFYSQVWRDEKVAAELYARLERSGAWRIAEALAG